MNYRIGFSNNSQPELALSEACRELRHPKLVLYFSGVEDFPEYTKRISEQFPEAITMGATTFAAFCKDGAYKETLMIIGFEDGIRCKAGILENADKYPLKNFSRVEAASRDFNRPENTFCLEFSSALIRCEELVLSTLNAVLVKKKIPVFGGSSGDHGNAEETMIALNGITYQDASVFVMIENQGGKIRFYRENIYKPTKHSFKSTSVDVRSRVVREYNQKPAANVMADALGVSVREMPGLLDKYPLGRIIGNEMFIVANNQVVDGRAMEYHARIYNNSQIVLLEPDDYRAVIRKTLEQVKNDCPKPSLTLMVNCLARSMLFESEGFLNEFAKIVGNTVGNYVGFSGYGEQLREQHFNQTMILAVFE
ncbi:FIST N-terminal domain-containing protein [Eubacteriaceae bacterium ES3]|nr:FIST N-terminal domain-containing protein [Eubacteriaceae bacterium ES3]